jgi:hypothetical protein
MKRKPEELTNEKRFIAKMHHLKDWCIQHSYEPLLVDQDWFKKIDAI